MYNSCWSEKGFPIWCSFSASSSQIFVYVNSFEKLLQDFCPFCILFICTHFLYQCTNLKFTDLPFGFQNPSSWQMSLSQVFFITIWQNITMSNSLNLHYFVSLYTIFIIPLCSCKFLKYYVSNLKHVSWKIFVNDFNPMAKIPVPYNFIFVNKWHFCQQITFSSQFF